MEFPDSERMHTGEEDMGRQGAPAAPQPQPKDDSKKESASDSFGTEELIASIWPDEDQYLDTASINPSTESPFVPPDEVPMEIQQNSRPEQADLPGNNLPIIEPEPQHISQQDSQDEMTLEELLISMGVIRAASPALPPQQTNAVANNGGNFSSGHVSGPPIAQVGHIWHPVGSYSMNNILYQPPYIGPCIGETSNQNSQRNRVVTDDAVARRRHRMSQNRHSAARSRARSRARVQQMEIEMEQMHEENRGLRLALARAKEDEKPQKLRRTSSSLW